MRTGRRCLSPLSRGNCRRKSIRRFLMPKSTQQGKPKKEELPDTLKRSPEKAQRTYAKAHDSAVETYGEGERAHRTAYSALKHTHEKRGDRWVAKDEKGPSDPRAKDPKARERSGSKEGTPTYEGVDVEVNNKEELYERGEGARRSGALEHVQGGPRRGGVAQAGLAPRLLRSFSARTSERSPRRWSETPPEPARAPFARIVEQRIPPGPLRSPRPPRKAIARAAHRETLPRIAPSSATPRTSLARRARPRGRSGFRPSRPRRGLDGAGASRRGRVPIISRGRCRADRRDPRPGSRGSPWQGCRPG